MTASTSVFSTKHADGSTGTKAIKGAICSQPATKSGAGTLQ